MLRAQVGKREVLCVGVHSSEPIPHRGGGTYSSWMREEQRKIFRTESRVDAPRPGFMLHGCRCSLNKTALGADNASSGNSDFNRGFYALGGVA